MNTSKQKREVKNMDYDFEGDVEFGIIDLGMLLRFFMAFILREPAVSRSVKISVNRKKKS